MNLFTTVTVWENSLVLAILFPCSSDIDLDNFTIGKAFQEALSVPQMTLCWINNVDLFDLSLKIFYKLSFLILFFKKSVWPKMFSCIFTFVFLPMQ